jgi:aldehyde:ferredoxin oxidoreductase
MDMAIPGDAPDHISRLLTAVTGISWTSDEVVKVGERVNNVARLFNIREGFTRADDTFPARLMTEPIKSGASKGAVITDDDLRIMLDEYYEARGWDKKGIPSKAKLDELGIKS